MHSATQERLPCDGLWLSQVALAQHAVRTCGRVHQSASKSFRNDRRGVSTDRDPSAVDVRAWFVNVRKVARADRQMLPRASTALGRSESFSVSGLR